LGCEKERFCFEPKYDDATAASLSDRLAIKKIAIGSDDLMQFGRERVG